MQTNRTRYPATAKLSSELLNWNLTRRKHVLQLERIDNKIAALKEEYNSHSVISNLLVEIICTIFEYAAVQAFVENVEGIDIKDWNHQPIRNYGQRRLEIVVSHVCRHWRDITPNQPRLWARFFNQCDEWVSSEAFAA